MPRRLLTTSALALILLRLPAVAGMPTVADVEKTVAAARQACEDKVAKIEKKLGKKKGEKAQREYGQAIADAWTEFAYVLETQAILCKRIKSPEALKLWEAYQAEVGKITTNTLAPLHKQGILMARPPQWFGETKWIPIGSDHVLTRGEHATRTKGDMENVLNYLNLLRSTQRRGVDPGAHAKLWQDEKRKEHDGFRTFPGPGSHCFYWFYIKAPTNQKVKVKIKLTKGADIKNVNINLEGHGSKKSASARFREGVNLLVIEYVPQKQKNIDLRVEVKGNGLQVMESPFGNM